MDILIVSSEVRIYAGIISK